MTQFEILWRAKFSSIPPIGHRLRDSYRERWVRFHALPKSKRYADSEEERLIILSRANRLADELFADQETFWLASSCVDVDLKNINFESKQYTIESRDLPKLFTWTDLAEATEDRITWATHSKLLCWNANAFDDVFQKVADEEDYGIIFAKSDMSSILAPYDGGFDIISTDAAKAADLRKKFPSWLSKRQDEL